MSTTSATKTFADFGVDPLICESLTEVGITHPFPIQELTLPLALTGADIIGQARTGTGKTLGFGLPLLQRLDLDGGLQCLIVVPTRELCMQVAEDLAQAGKGRGVKVAALYGGKAMQPQIDALQAGAHVVVGTPGRLLDLSRRGHLDLSHVHGLVLDEADEMLDLGFLPDVEALIEQCAEDRQTLLFSATMPAQIVGLARRYMRTPTFMRADVEEVHIAPATKQYFFSCHRMDKPAVLARILQTPDRGLCVVFCRTKRMADQLAEELRDRDVTAQAIHSDLRQEARERAMEKFRAGKITVLCATEVAARGLDIDDVTHVVNYDCPDDEKMYLHRIGRTGRAGAKGVAITFAVWNELPRLEMIRRELDIEEEVHEVFSTSPLLDELFDLPAREERKKVPSPPKARTGKASRSGRRSSRDTSEGTTEGDGAAGGRDAAGARGRKDAGDTATRNRSRGRGAAPESEEQAEGESSDSRTRTRRRSRRGGSDGSDGSDGASSADTATDTATDTAADTTDAGTAEGTSRGSDDADDRPRRRTRSRSTGSRTSRADGGRGRAGEDATDADDEVEGAAEGTEDRGRRRRAKDTSGDTAEDTAKAKGERDGRKGGNGRERGKGRSRRGGDGDARGGERSRSSRRDDDRSGSGRGRRERSGGGSRQRADVDASTARGSGTPRLRRKMEVVHLP